VKTSQAIALDYRIPDLKEFNVAKPDFRYQYSQKILQVIQEPIRIKQKFILLGKSEKKKKSYEIEIGNL